MKPKLKAEELLTDCPYNIAFGWIDKDALGICDHRKEKIVINIELLIVDTFVHEQLHACFPALTEKQVKEKTRKKVNRMTVREIRELARLLTRRIICT